MRKVLIAAAAAATVVVCSSAALGVDFGAGIYAEYRLARACADGQLGFDPCVAILAFPFIPQAMRHHYRQLEIRPTLSTAGVARPRWRPRCTRST